MIIGRLVPHALLVAFLATEIFSTADESRPSRSFEAPFPSAIATPVAIPAKKTLPMVDATGTWENLLSNDEMNIDIEASSIKQLSKYDHYEVFVRMRIGFSHEIDVAGKKEKGWYYINEMVANCQEDVLRIDKSTVFDKNGKELATGEDLGSLANPKSPKSFISLWLHVTCKDLKNQRPPKII